MKFIFLKVESSKEKWCEEVTSLYFEKLNHFLKFEINTLSSKKIARAASVQKKQLESEEILSFLQKDDFVVLFDEKGKTFDSIAFSNQVSRIMDSGKKRCVWIIGGAFGVSDELKERANLKISLAPFVMNHLVAQTVALEQIYRSFTIIKGLPYHNS
jgi:23S rRNA (pseudouridine1915-N3)-methyltransferase